MTTWRYSFFFPCAYENVFVVFGLFYLDAGVQTLLAFEKFSSLWSAPCVLFAQTPWRWLDTYFKIINEGPMTSSLRIFLHSDEGNCVSQMRKLNSSLVELCLCISASVCLESALHGDCSWIEVHFSATSHGKTWQSWVQVGIYLVPAMNSGKGTGDQEWTYLLFPQVWAGNGTVLLLMSQKSLSSCSDSL